LGLGKLLKTNFSSFGLGSPNGKFLASTQFLLRLIGAPRIRIEKENNSQVISNSTTIASQLFPKLVADSAL
jgi:hypothetical protein